MAGQGNRLGIIAGAGELPLALARAAEADGRSIFVLALEGMVSRNDVASFSHAFVSIGELSKAIKLLKEADCSDVTLAGKVARPEFSKLKVDVKGAFALPKLIAAAARGDDALLRAIVGIMENEGFRVIGSTEAASTLAAPVGPIGRLKPGPEHQSDIRGGVKVALTMGALDIGQAAVVCEGLVLAVEAAEGTDAMLQRVAGLPAALRGSPENRKGVLVKGVKPQQERRVDLPVIGIRTVELAAAAGLAGIAVEAGAALIVNRSRVAEEADRHGLFVLGFSPEDYRQ
jgi:DUF1009 family protein